MANKRKESKDTKVAKRHVTNDSSHDDSTSGGSSLSSSSSDSEPESRIKVKKSKLASSTKKQRKREKKREEKKKKKKELNQISKDDYFHKSIEFRVWLVEEKDKCFDQLSGSKSRTYFKKFVKRWNGGKLAKKFYRGIDHEDARASLTNYTWKFAKHHTPPKKKLDIAKYNDRHSVSDGHMTPIADGLMRPRTFSTFGKTASVSSIESPTSAAIGPSRPIQGPVGLIQGPSRPVQGPMLPPSSLSVNHEDRQEQDRRQLKHERKEFRKYNDLVMEELAPKATGHEAKIEKKIARNAQRRRRGDSPETRESFLFGGKSNIQSQMAAHRQKKEQRLERLETKAATKLELYQAKEKAKMKALLEQARANKSENALW